jgi:hypothetical protein
MNKLIGFLVQKDEKLPRIDFFNRGLKTVRIMSCGYNIFLWYLGGGGD